MSDETPKPKKVFISYSWTTPDYEMRVLSWAERLRGDSILQADVVLFVASLLEANRRRAWYPRTLIYSGYGRTCELFTRATSKRFFENLIILFGVASKEDFTAKIEEAFKLHRVDQWSQLTFYSDVSWNVLLNLERLASAT
ncbi:MAG TPA: hypothetical protein VE344_00495 [Methylomirabilota bacterium]|nr:hypothetical protein [Methylomirabilota bacterium]